MHPHKHAGARRRRGFSPDAATRHRNCWPGRAEERRGFSPGAAARHPPLAATHTQVWPRADFCSRKHCSWPKIELSLHGLPGWLKSRKFEFSWLKYNVDTYARVICVRNFAIYTYTHIIFAKNCPCDVCVCICNIYTYIFTEACAEGPHWPCV